MLDAENCQELLIKPRLDRANAFKKAAARITIISVLSRQVNTKSAILGNESVLIKLKEIQEPEPPKLQVSEVSTNISMSSTNVLPARRDPHLPIVKEGSNEEIAGTNGGSNGHNGMNGDAVLEGTGAEGGAKKCTRHSVKNSGVSKNAVNGEKDGVNGQSQPNLFDYMKERKLSEPVISPRKSLIAPKLTRCHSTVDLRNKEQPMVLRELGGYKFFQKASEIKPESKTKCQPYRGNEHKPVSEVTALKNTIAEQKENITNREKHVLHLEKNLAMLENENSKNKKQVSSFREKLKDCSGTVDYLRREKEVLASERDRLSFTLLTCEHELKELRTQNINLVTEYESAEHSRKIAVCHLQEVERVCLETHQDSVKPFGKRPVDSPGKNSSKNNKISKKFLAHLTCMKEAIQKLRVDREALQNEHKKVSSFFSESLNNLVNQVRDIDSKRTKIPENSHQDVVSTGQEPSNEDVFVEPGEPTTDSGEMNELQAFKRKLRSNEKSIDELANQIRDLENRKKGLLETRFGMIQEFQAGREVVEDWETDTSGNDVEERSEVDTGGDDRKRSRVTRKIRKLERTLSMDHGVGKLDCIQKLCKKLEDCEQRIHELETTNAELRTEHDDMEEEAKYLKYVLSYRGDVMKAQLQNEYETKMAALRKELTKNASSEVKVLTQRNRALEEEVQRLHEELSTLLQNLPALQTNQRSSSRSSEYEADVSTNSADASVNHLDDSRIIENISRTPDHASKNLGYQSTGANSENCIQTSENSVVNAMNNSQNRGGETVRSLEEKVSQLTEEKRVLLLSMQTLTGQWTSRENCAENETSFSQNVNVLERNFREVEQENACLMETLRHVRDVLEREGENENGDKISKLKDEMQRLDEKVETSRRGFEEDKSKEEAAILSCVRHERRISELEMEVYRLHEEKKSLLSSIVRMQTDPNFTLSDDFNSSDVTNVTDVTTSDVTSDGVINSGVIDAVNSPPTKESAVSLDSNSTSKDNDGVLRTHRPLVKMSSRDEEVQVSMNREDIYGLLGYLQRDLDKLRSALDHEGIAGNKSETEDVPGHDMTTCPRQDSVQEVEQLNKELKDLGDHTHVLEEKLHESESIRSDLHRTISIATDMASEERQKCEELMRTKAALEKEMLKLAKENRDLREGLETLSRARKRRKSSRAPHASLSSDHHEGDDGCVVYLPRAKAQNFSESEISDLDSPMTEAKSYSRTL